MNRRRARQNKIIKSLLFCFDKETSIALFRSQSPQTFMYVGLSETGWPDRAKFWCLLTCNWVTLLHRDDRQFMSGLYDCGTGPTYVCKALAHLHNVDCGMLDCTQVRGFPPKTVGLGLCNFVSFLKLRNFLNCARTWNVPTLSFSHHVAISVNRLTGVDLLNTVLTILSFCEKCSEIMEFYQFGPI
jgi:hypothetical protein